MTTPYIWGSNEFGQLGLNDDEKEFKEKFFKVEDNQIDKEVEMEWKNRQEYIKNLSCE